jgi:hypothetical protein
MDGYHGVNVFYSQVHFWTQLDQELWNMDIIGNWNWDICLDLDAGESCSCDIPRWLDIRQDQPYDWPVWRQMFPALFIKVQNFSKM